MNDIEKIEVFNRLNEYIDSNEKFKGAYFWSPPGNASGRRYYEDKNSLGEYQFKNGNLDVYCKFDVSCSCKNIYVYQNYKIDNKNTTIRGIKKIAAKIAVEILKDSSDTETERLIDALSYLTKRELKREKALLLALQLSSLPTESLHGVKKLLKKIAD